MSDALAARTRKDDKTTVYIHVGLGKAGSTSIQNGFLRQRDALLEHHGIYYGPMDSEFNNDYAFFQRLISGDAAYANEYVTTLMRTASARGAKRVLISCEDLTGIPYHIHAFEAFKKIIANTSEARFEIIVVVRDLRAFLRSNLVQMMRSGVTLYDNRMAMWIIKMIRAYMGCEIPMHFLSLEDPLAQESLLNSFLSFMSPVNFPLEERRDNATPRRPETFHAILGQVLKTEANARDVLPTATALNAFARELEDLYDSFEIWDGPDKGYCLIGSAHHFVAAFELKMQQVIERYIESAMSAVDADDLQFYNSLLSRRIGVSSNTKINISCR